MFAGCEASGVLSTHPQPRLNADATLPTARRRGIGASVTRLPLLETRNEGYRVGTLQSSDMGRPVYENLGFRDVCSFELYLRQQDN